MSAYFSDFALASDNWSGAHPKLLAAMAEAGEGYSPAYGGDKMTAKAEEMISDLFGGGVPVFLTFNGTGANVATLAAMVGRTGAVVCPDTAHINTHETGAVERLLGAKLLCVPNHNGKILPEQIMPYLPMREDLHCACPQVVSISQTTELGTVYSPDEIKAVCDAAHGCGMTVHMDGARFANAVAALGCTSKELARDTGVDVLCFGGTKNGFVFGEAIVFFNKDLAVQFAHLRKQYLQLSCKMRFIAAQFVAALEEGLWLEMAANANKMAARLADGIQAIPQIQLTASVDSNQIFVQVPLSWDRPLQELTGVGLEPDGSTRWVTSFAHQEEQIDQFVYALRELANS